MRGNSFVKILFLVRQLNIGGAERQLVILANELASRGHDIVIASYYPGGILSEGLDTGRVRLVCLEKRSRWDLFSPPSRTAARETVRALREHGLDP